MINPANIGYLPAIILKELEAGRKCEVSGSIVARISTKKDYDDRKYRLIGKFGELSYWKEGVAMIFTRDPPDWAKRVIDDHIYDCDEMYRWFVPKEKR